LSFGLDPFLPEAEPLGDRATARVFGCDANRCAAQLPKATKRRCGRDCLDQPMKLFRILLDEQAKLGDL
jgi:hypothetical protein